LKFCINDDPKICGDPAVPPCLDTEGGAALRWKELNNQNPGANNGFYAGAGDVGKSSCRNRTGVTYAYQSPMPFEIEYIGGTNDLLANIIPDGMSPKELTASLGDYLSSCGGITSDMWNTLKITLSNRGTGSGVIRLTNVKFNDIELGDFCLKDNVDGGGGSFKDILVDLGGYDFEQGAVVTGNVVLCGEDKLKFDNGEKDKVEFGFVKVTPLP
jgi:hypothetical protein